MSADDPGRAAPPETAERDDAARELARIRDRIDALDRGSWRCSTSAPSWRATPGGRRRVAGRRAIRDAEREREVLLRVAMANAGPLPQADLLSIYRRLMPATRTLEARDRAARPGPVRLTTGAVRPGGRAARCPPPGRRPSPGSRPRPPASSTWATSRTRSPCGASRGRRAAA